MLNLNSLNQAQREAVMHGEGPLLVLAGPGSGKTFTITRRICYLLEQKIAPEQILVITFTKDAALSMQRRFWQATERTVPVNFGTFHSVFYHILRESHFFESKQSHPILNDSQKKKLIVPIVKSFLSGEELQYRQNDLSDEAISILSAISYYKNTGEEKEAIEMLSEELRPHFQAIFEGYERERRKRKLIDFDDMVYECRRVLEQDEALKKYWQGRFRHILVDEFQDSNPMQYKVLKLLLAQPYNLFAVGDDDQSIYGFRGSKPACLKQFVREYGAKQICLDINYRSRKTIVEASRHVIEESKERFPKKLRPAPEKKGKNDNVKDIVCIRAFEEREQQYEYLLEQLRALKEGKTVGVLFRTNAYMQGLATRLSKEGIPYTMKEKAVSIYEHFIVKDIVAYIKVARGEGSRGDFLQIMNKPSRYISRESLDGEGIPDLREIISYYRRKGLDSRNIQVIWNLEKWEKQMKYLEKASPYLAVQYIRRVVGYESYLKEKAGGKQEVFREWQELLDWLCEDAAHYTTVQEWFDAQESYTGRLGREKQEGQKDTPAISLMTVHASKGLEFDRVYIPDCNEKIYPHGNMVDEKSCEEERRIFYVAMTRAKENLELLYLTGTKERPRLSSRFLNPLLRDYSSTSSSNSQESRYSSKASATFSYSSSSSI